MGKPRGFSVKILFFFPFSFLLPSGRGQAHRRRCHLLLPSAREDKDPRVVPISHSSSSLSLTLSLALLLSISLPVETLVSRPPPCAAVLEPPSSRGSRHKLPLASLYFLVEPRLPGWSLTPESGRPLRLRSPRVEDDYIAVRPPPPPSTFSTHSW